MCRLYAIRSIEPTKVECTLVHSQNALLLQSREDLTGRRHSDGWGIAYYEDGVPRVEKRASAAFSDLSFSHAAERIYAKTVIAHVRLATVGELKPENAHPFSFARWAFAHNGTVEGFANLRREMLNETLPVLRESRGGETDSEHLFHWLLSRLVDRGADLRQGITDVTRQADIVAESLSQLDLRCRAVQPEKPPKLNVVLTDGESMIVTRWNNSLFWLNRAGLHDCDICGIPHVHHEHDASYRAIVVASEPLSDEPWLEVPNCSVLKIDTEVRAELVPFQMPVTADAPSGA